MAWGASMRVLMVSERDFPSDTTPELQSYPTCVLTFTACTRQKKPARRERKAAEEGKDGATDDEAADID